MSSKAPTFDKMAISPQRSGLGQQTSARPRGPGQPDPPETVERERAATAERERVAVAVDFGAALENLVAYARLRQEESDAVPQTSGPRFPPDLLLRRDPEDILRSTCRKLLRLESTLLGLDRPGATIPPLGPPNSDKPPASNGHPASAIPSNSDESSASKAPPTSQMSSASERRSNSTEHPTSAGPSTNQPEEQTPQTGSRNQGEPQTSNGHQPQEKSQTDQPEGKAPKDKPQNQGGSQTPNGHHPKQRPRPTPGISAQPTPSREWKIEEKVDALLRASARGGGGSRDLEHSLSDLDNAIGEWNEDVVEHIVDSPAVLSAYRVGKALSLTRWRIWVAKHWKQVNGDPSVSPWEKAFCKERVDEIQRHVNVLSTVLDPQAVTAVATGLGYWRNALLSLTPTEGPSSTRPRSWWRNALLNLASIGDSSSARSRSSQPPSAQAIKVPPEHGEKLLTALEEQLANWLDLLTGRRPPESFPVAGIVTTLTKKMANDLWTRLFRLLVPIVIVLVILAGLFGAVYLMVNEGFWEALRDNLTKLLTSLGTALAAVFTFLFAPRGRSLPGRGAGAMYGAGGRIGGGAHSRGLYYGAGALMNAAASLKQNALTSVVDQLKVEELNLAVSEPLMRCVLALNDRESKKGDPLKDAERFLRLIYRDKSNLDRLRPVFKDLYKH